MVDRAVSYGEDAFCSHVTFEGRRAQHARRRPITRRGSEKMEFTGARAES